MPSPQQSGPATAMRSTIPASQLKPGDILFRGTTMTVRCEVLSAVKTRHVHPSASFRGERDYIDVTHQFACDGAMQTASLSYTPETKVEIEVPPCAS